MTIKAITSASCEQVIEGSRNALDKFARENGLTVSQKGCATYDTRGGTVKVSLEFALEGVNPAENEFNDYAWRYNLEEEDFGAEFRANGKRYTVCGLAPRSPKYPLLGKEVGTDKVYKFTRHVIDTKIIPNRKAA